MRNALFRPGVHTSDLAEGEIGGLNLEGTLLVVSVLDDDILLFLEREVGEGGEGALDRESVLHLREGDVGLVSRGEQHFGGLLGLPAPGDGVVGDLPQIPPFQTDLLQQGLLEALPVLQAHRLDLFQLRLEGDELALHVAVPVVFNIVVCPALEVLADNGPLVAVYSVEEVEYPLLGDGPLGLDDVGVEVVVPPLPALFAYSPLEVVGYVGPLPGSELGDEGDQELVVLLSPGF